MIDFTTFGGAKIKQAQIFNDEAITSTGVWQTLATPTTLSVDVPPSGVLRVFFSAAAYGDTVDKYISIALSGANTFTPPNPSTDAATAKYVIRNSANIVTTLSKEVVFTGLTPGSTTVTMMFRGAVTTSKFFLKSLIAEPKY